MASLKSMKIKLDSAKKDKSKSKSKSRSQKIDKEYKLVAVEPEELPKPKTIVHKQKSIKDYLPKREVKKNYMQFDEVVNQLPFGLRVGYKLKRKFTDRRSGILKNIYCNSGFYRGTSHIEVFSRCENKVIMERIIKVSSGGKVYEIRKDDLLEFYVFIDELNEQLWNGKAKQCYDNAINIRSKSLSHIDVNQQQSQPQSRLKSRGGKANNILHRDSPSRTIKKIKPVERKANSLLH